MVLAKIFENGILPCVVSCILKLDVLMASLLPSSINTVRSPHYPLSMNSIWMDGIFVFLPWVGSRVGKWKF